MNQYTAINTAAASKGTPTINNVLGFGLSASGASDGFAASLAFACAGLFAFTFDEAAGLIESASAAAPPSFAACFASTEAWPVCGASSYSAGSAISAGS